MVWGDCIENPKWDILDVGCGTRPRGDVNLDITKRDVPNFVLGNALHLPFEPDEFITVYSSGLSLWQKISPFEDLIKAFAEAERVANVQVVMEYAFFKNATWNCYSPTFAYKELKKTFPGIKLSLSQRQARYKPISIFVKIFGIRLTIFVLNKILRTSFLAKLKIKKLPLQFPELRTNSKEEFNE